MKNALEEVAKEAIWYSNEYKCDLHTALRGCIWGLTAHEEYIVAKKLGIAE